MASTSFMQEAFIGGEISQVAQGRISHPFYRASLNVCLNMIPIEAGALHRRPGTRHASITRSGGAAKLIPFDFQNSTPYVMEFTNGMLRFWADGVPAQTNDGRFIDSISATTPAVIGMSQAQDWGTSSTIVYTGSEPMLQNRQFAITVINSTSFSIADATNGDPIDGTGMSVVPGDAVFRIREVETPFGGTSWQNVRSVQAETTAILLNGTRPQILDVTEFPSDGHFAAFSLAPSDFLDGPYLDAFRGSYMNSSGLSGVVTLTLSFQPYSASVAYDIGDYVTSSSVGYRSKTAANQGNTPASSPTNWLVVNAGDPINNGSGFTSADIGRLVRLFSEPALWDASATYTTGQVVSYADADGTSFWSATGSISAGVKPGTVLTWAVVTGASVAIWTWARILSISGAGLTAPDTVIGDMSNPSSAFDTVTSKSFASAANASQATLTYPVWAPVLYTLGTIVNYGGAFYRLDQLIIGNEKYVVNWYQVPPPSASPFVSQNFWTQVGGAVNMTFDVYVGQHFSSATQIAAATVYPSTDIGFTNSPQSVLTLNLRANSVAPTSAGDGILLGTTGAITNSATPLAINSSDRTTAWNYVWIELTSAYNQPLPDDGSHSFTGKAAIAQVQFFAPNVANGSVVTAQIVGDPLLYSGPIRTWRLGVYGGTGGWPTNGTYHEGRLWLSGVVGNRVDSSKSNDIFNFAPTTPAGIVAPDNAISAVFDGPDVNAILWMTPDEQGIICGTQAGEWLVTPASPGAMAPGNIAARRRTKIGCADIEPRRTDHTLVFVQKFQRAIMEYFADVYSGKFSAPSLSDRSKHITISGIEDIAYQQELVSVVWARRGDGKLIGTTYQRNSLTTSQGPNLAAAHRHEHGGGRSITSMCVGGAQSGNLDALYMVTVGADGVHHVEIMTNVLDEGFALRDVWQVDDGIVPTSIVVTTVPAVGSPYGGVTFNGLWVHNGKTVSAWLLGLDCGDFVVTNGSIFVPFGDGVSASENNSLGGHLFTVALVQPFVDAGLPLPACIGFTFTSDGQIVRPATAAESGTQAGPAFGKLRRAQQYAVQLYGALHNSISFGVSFDALTPLAINYANEKPYPPTVMFNGIIRTPVESSNDYDNMLCWRITRPVPAVVIAVGEYLHTQDG